MGEVVDLLGIGTAHVLFGHTHRVGPRPVDSAAEWITGAGVHLHNTGSWVYERQFLSTTPYESPYWPGTAIRVDASGPPRLLHVLDGVGTAELNRALG
jgi:hypothetical protein